MSNATHEAHGPKEIPISIDRKPYKAPETPMTGAQSKALAGVGSDYDLWYETPGPADDVKLRDGESFDVRQGQHFYSVPSTINPGC